MVPWPLSSIELSITQKVEMLFYELFAARFFRKPEIALLWHFLQKHIENFYFEVH